MIQLYSGTGTTHSESGLTGGLTYQFKVRAVNIFGEGTFSSTISVVAGQVPDAPSSLNAVYDNSNIKVTWAAPTDNNYAID